MNTATEENKLMKTDNMIESFEEEELVFVIVGEQKTDKVAIEGRYGIVATAETLDNLKQEIIGAVQKHFSNQFKGTIRIRQFVDTIISA